MRAALFIVAGVFILTGSMRRAEHAPNWPSQLGWVVIGCAGVTLGFLCAAEVGR